MLMDKSDLGPIMERLERIEAALAVLVRERTVKEWYTTADVAQVTGKAEYTIREWCRKGQIPAEKARNGRGWLVSHETLSLVRNGSLPLPENKVHGGPQRGGA
jgi:excisionase family DNA binding protein